MTMKYLDKNVSAEFDEVVVTNASLNNGVLTFTRKDFYTDSTDGLSVSIDLKDIKLRIYKLKEGESLGDYEGDLISDEKKLRRETHLFLVPASQSSNQYANDEGIYEEYIWDGKRFEMLGATHLNLEPLEGRITNVETAINTLNGRVNSLESNVTNLQNNKVDKESGKSLIETSKIAKLDSIQEGANKTVVDTEIKTSNNPVSNTAIKNALSNKVDKETGKDLMTDDERTKLNRIEVEANKTIIVDVVADNNTNAVSSNAVYDYVTNEINTIVGDIHTLIYGTGGS